MQKQIDRERKLTEERPLVVSSRQVIAATASLHAAASPGPSGFHTSYIQAIAQCPGGLDFSVPMVQQDGGCLYAKQHGPAMECRPCASLL